MKQLDIRKYLFDINEACELLLQFIAGKTFSDYAIDPMLRSAVERQYQPTYPPKGSRYLDERTEQGMSGKENTLLPMPDPVRPRPDFEGNAYQAFMAAGV